MRSKTFCQFEPSVRFSHVSRIASPRSPKVPEKRWANSSGEKSGASHKSVQTPASKVIAHSRASRSQASEEGPDAAEGDEGPGRDAELHLVLAHAGT